jgi:hypothetical protein
MSSKIILDSSAVVSRILVLVSCILVSPKIDMPSRVPKLQLTV